MAWLMAKLPVMMPSLQKWANKVLLQYLHELLSLCWREGKVPQDMCDAKIVTLFKNKGDWCDCNNYRGISLLSVVGKVFARVVLARLQILADHIYPEPQCGFRSGRSTVDMIFCQTIVREMQGTTTVSLSCLYRLDQSLWHGQQDWTVQATWENRVPT